MCTLDFLLNFFRGLCPDTVLRGGCTILLAYHTFRFYFCLSVTNGLSLPYRGYYVTLEYKSHEEGIDKQ